MSLKGLVYLSLKSLALTRYLIALAILLPLFTFLQNPVSSITDSSKNCNTCSNHILSTSTSNRSFEFSTITLLLATLTFRPPFLHTKYSTNAIRSSSNLPYKNKSFANKEPGKLYTHSSFWNPSLQLPIPIFTSSITVSIYILKSLGDMIYHCLTPIQAILVIYILLIPFNSLLAISYILSTCHHVSILILLYAFSKSIKPKYTLHFFIMSFTYLH